MYFMSTACGRPQGVGGPAHVDKGEGGQKLVDVINGLPIISLVPQEQEVKTDRIRFKLLRVCDACNCQKQRKTLQP